MATMAREKRKEGSHEFAGSQKKQGRAERGITIRYPDALTEVRFKKFVEDFDGTQPEALGFILSDYLKDKGY